MKTPKPVLPATDPPTVHKQFTAPQGQERTRDATHQGTSTQSHRPVEPTASGARRIGKYCFAGSGLAATAGLVVRYPELFCVGSGIVLLIVCAYGYVAQDRASEPRPTVPNPGHDESPGAGAETETTAMVLDAVAEIGQFTYQFKGLIQLVSDASVPAEKIRELAMQVLRILDGTETAVAEWYRREAAGPKARFEQEMSAIGVRLTERVREAAAHLRQALAADDIDSARQQIAKSMGILDSVAKAETLIVRALTHPAAG